MATSHSIDVPSVGYLTVAKHKCGKPTMKGERVTLERVSMGAFYTRDVTLWIEVIWKDVSCFSFKNNSF